MKRITMFFFVTIIFIIPFLYTYGQVERRELGNLVIEDIPEIPQRIIEKVFQYQNTRAAGFIGWLPDNSGMLIATRFGETAQVHLVEKPGGARKQLTFFPEPVGNGMITPDKQKRLFVFSKDVGGGEFYQLFSFDISTGKYQMLTDGKSRNSPGSWNNKGNKFSYTSTKRNSVDYDVYLMDELGNEELIFEGKGLWSAGDWDKNDSKIILGNYISINESYLYTYDLSTKKLEQINPSEEKVSYSGALWGKDGKGIYFISDENDEFRKLKYYDLSTKIISVITKDINWDVEGMAISPKGDKLVFDVNEDGINKLYILDTKTNKYSTVKNIPIGQIGGLEFNHDGTKLGLTINTPKTPGDVYSVDMKSLSLERWTFSEVGGLNTDNFIEPELIRYPTFDEVDGKPRMIPAFVYKPKGNGPFPILIDIHGGPEAQFRPGFSSFTQYLVNELGIAVISPNVRGSSGYGKTYLTLDNWYKREESVWDIGKLLDWIETQSNLDENKVCVYGGSYGGYMVLSSMVHYNDRLKCGIDVVGISNFVTFLENTQAYRRDLRRVEYGDERDPEMREFLNKISPLNNAEKITKPMFVVQGLNDPRVPVTEAEQIVQKIRENKNPVWYLLAKDEGHGFQKKSNRDYQINSTILFLEENLLK